MTSVKPGLAEFVDLHLIGPHVGTGRPAERHDPGPGPGCHRGNAVVVGVEDGYAVGRERRRQLALGCRDLVQATELAGVRMADAQHSAKPGRRDGTQLRDVAGSRVRPFPTQDTESAQ